MFIYFLELTTTKSPDTFRLTGLLSLETPEDLGIIADVLRFFFNFFHLTNRVSYRVQRKLVPMVGSWVTYKAPCNINIIGM